MADGPSAARSDDESDAVDSTGTAGDGEAGREERPADSAENAADDPQRDEDDLSVEELRAQVEEKYDFDNFGPQDMEQMTAREWDAVFDPESWITGTELLDRLEADLKNRVLDRDVFARIERFEDPERLVAYSDEGYAVVYGDGTVEGMGTVLRDVKPSVALASMEEYEVAEMPDGEVLPTPLEVPEGGGDLGHQVLQVVAAVQLLMGVGLVFSPLVVDLGQSWLVALVAGLGFVVIGVLLFFVVANARLSDKFRAEEYRNRLRAIGLDSDERPAFLDELEAEGRLANAEDDSTEDAA
ncbi:hypothetical protein ACFPYI_03020 [Halomarina salina]|uniref:DUF7319 domain-containing protein n=1 Tax=Halomarina salina TaxID=1872699 RepID=A0ABD5RIX5_9EURY|nr:hypothetical protein [Halomarina salina]